MKYVVLLGDGMSDRPLKELGGRTPLIAARTPNMDAMATHGQFGYLNSASESFLPGSDIMNLNILGYPVERYYTGRAPLEASSIGVDLKEEDVAFRCNLVTLSEEGLLMEDYSAGHISTEEASSIIKTLDSELGREGLRFYPGKSYRHIMVLSGGPDGLDLTPPHDITNQPANPHLPKDQRLLELTHKSWEILRSHPVNLKRVKSGKRPATSIWLWGEGKKPNLPSFEERYGLKGSIISAVDLMKGIGIYLGLKVVEVPGATGYLDTNYIGKANAAIDELTRCDFVFVHVEAPDEASHNGDIEAKIKAIEDFDAKVVGTVLEGLRDFDSWKVLVLSDHSTLIELRTHVKDPVPFAYLSSNDSKERGKEGAFGEVLPPQVPKAHQNYISSCEGFLERFFKI